MHPAMTSTNDAYDYVRKLYLRNVILYEGDYYIHSSFWYLCNKEASKNKLFHALNYRGDALQEGNIKCQRRLCIQNSILLAIEDVQNSMAFASRVRSLLCTGDFHDYPVPLCLEHLRFLRYTLNIRFYEFPMEVMKLVHLRYFALTYDGSLPHSISKLLNLQYLIVGRHVRIVKPDGVISYLPIEVWNMKELKYVQIMGRDLPHPCHDEGSLLPNILQLLGVRPQSCTKDVLEKIPNLKVLELILECYAFRGPKWVVRDYEFQKLEMIKIQDNDLEQWTFGSYCCFPAVDIVSIEHCYKSKEIPLTFGTTL